MVGGGELNHRSPALSRDDDWPTRNSLRNLVASRHVNARATTPSAEVAEGLFPQHSQPALLASSEPAPLEEDKRPSQFHCICLWSSHCTQITSMAVDGGRWRSMAVGRGRTRSDAVGRVAATDPFHMRDLID